ncbi:protoporphyrinogen oxidase-like protein [candidate division KSB3 bacterium]|uniref:Protoporphyrinogen oxidase-like protein n=1 Tax=candidate division KSB3 bacterium TaxID=2044937 RepID=A0A9D5JTQ8_9BACT|nr:protoporphyrinogen oxidase-like protein [candidate division KSB3 bacterium]MBD3324069.1 protoporphyrinogen oxidase-like protein [candidate division KSB3 bacterium]
MKTPPQNLIVGAGMTGLAAGLSTGWPIYEATDAPGGICASYYLRPGSAERLWNPPGDQEAYRFELGGGHWIFGANSAMLAFMQRYSSLKQYQRDSAVYFPEESLYVPYPLQNHLRYLPADIVQQILMEITTPASNAVCTMRDWLTHHFGPTLCERFFYPFHESYTAGLYPRIAPQDAYKSPVDRTLVMQGASNDAPPVGYNTAFCYPASDLCDLARRLAAEGNIHYNKRVERIDVTDNTVYFADGSAMPYEIIISTVPLNQMLAMTELESTTPPDPYTSVLVLNIGAVRGKACPQSHWLYIPQSRAGFHRVGFYGNVDQAFLPRSARGLATRVSLYIERAYPGGQRPASRALSDYTDAVINELQEWNFIEEVDVVDQTWIEVAYTWKYPDSVWQQESMQTLRAHGIYQAGRYGRWKFQGIAESLQEGLSLGRELNNA